MERIYLKGGRFQGNRSEPKTIECLLDRALPFGRIPRTLVKERRHVVVAGVSRPFLMDARDALHGGSAIVTDLVDPSRNSEGESVDVGMIGNAPGMVKRTSGVPTEAQDMGLDAVEGEGHRIERAQPDRPVAGSHRISLPTDEVERVAE